MTSLRAWWEETHGAGIELVRHFLARFFDSEAVSTAGGWQKVAIGLFAALFSASLLGLRIYFHRYNHFESPAFHSGQIYREYIRADILGLAGVAMAVTALATLLLWQSLFPGKRDYLALAGLPISPRQIFQAKATALLLLFAAFLLALTVAPAVSFATVTGGRWQENPSALVNVAANFSAATGACVFVFFSLLALQGLLLNVLPPRLFARVSLLLQGGLFVVTLGALPLFGRQPASAAWWPPVWFLRLWESLVTGPSEAARPAVLAITLPPLIALLAYLVSYSRYRRLLLEAPLDRSERQSELGSWLLERWIADPREQASFSFIWKSLARSRGHLLILLACGGVALGWITNGALDAPLPSLRDEGMYGLLVVLVPLALAMLATVGLRYVFSLPTTLQANWAFQITDRTGSSAWLNAMERFVVWCGISPILLAGLPATVAVLGWIRAVAAVLLMFFAARLCFEALFRGWRKMPFTCSYLPGKTPMWLLAVRYGVAIPFLAPAGKLILQSSGDLTSFATLFVFQAVVLWRLRAARLKNWSRQTLCYEEEAPPAVMTLDLKPADELRTQGSQEAPAFSGALVASRGLIPQAWAEEIREERRDPVFLLHSLLSDVRHGIRLIRRNPLFSAVVVVTLTAGIGFNASVFTVVNGMAFRPHVQRDPSSFVRVIPMAARQATTRQASYGEFVAFREQSRTLGHLAAWAHFPAFVGEDNSAGSIGMAVSCNFFQVDGLHHALLGRLLTFDDCVRSGSASSVLISEALWRGRFASDPRVIGRVVDVNSRPAIIVGVVPTGTAGWTRTAGWTGATEIWVPFTAQAYFEPSASDLFAGDELWLSLAGRLKKGYSRSDARAEISVLVQRHDELHPGRRSEVVTTDGSWMEELELTLSGQQLMLVGLFFAAFSLVLFISCANVATLLLARAASERREIAVRLSLGAGRIRLIRMLVTESVLLAAIAGALSIWLAAHVPEPLFRLLAGRPADFAMPPDWRTFAYIAAAVTLTGFLAGLAPALEALKVDLTGWLKGGGVEGAGVFRSMGNSQRLQGLLVSAQVAMSMVLLVAAVLFAQAERETLRADAGFQPRKLVVAPLYFPESTNQQTAAVRLLAITQRVNALPGVRSVAFSEGMPLFNRATVELRPPARPDASQPVDIYTASPAFFQTLGVRLLQGREFRLGDATAVVVSQSLARAFWRGQNPVGKSLPLPSGTATVVGVVGDVSPMRFGGSDNPALYRPWRVHAMRNVLSVRFDSGEATGAAAVRAAIHELYPDTPVTARLAQTWIDQMTEDVWNVVTLIIILGLVAALLAVTGIYGAVSFAVNRRMKELGIRVALGASKSDIVREVFVSGGKPVLRGLLVGTWLAAALGAGLRRSFQGWVIRLDAADPFLYAAPALLLAAAAALAMLGPARRGTRSDPLDSLRCE